MLGGKDLQPGQQATQTVSYNKDTLGFMLSLYIHTRYTLHVWVCMYTYTDRQDYMQAR